MRFTYACFKGYIGFYNGLGLEKVEINFNLCKNNIILIHGINGSGKSTLLDALNVFPDPSSSFTPNIDGEKLLTLVNNNDIYNIRIISPCDIKGGRKQTKAFISKNGLELNSNGNITSYKEIIFSEFELDSNYISLSKLSCNDRGLGDKSPSERKKFASNIVENLETYNDIYKTLNKKSLIFKSHINNLHTKIQNIGMRDNLEMTVKSLRQKESELNTRIMDLNNKIVAIEAKSTIDEDEAKRIQSLNNQILELENIINPLRSNIKGFVHKTQIKESEIKIKCEEDSKLLEFYNNKITELSSLWMDKSKRLSSTNDSIVAMEAELSSYSNNIDKQLEDKYKSSNLRLEEINKDLASLNIEPDIELIYTIKNVLDLYDEFIKKIDLLYDKATPEMLNFICIVYDPLVIDKLKKESNELILKIESIREEINERIQHMKDLSILENRPKDCTNNSCPFISMAVEVSNKLSGRDVCKELEALQLEQTKLSNKITENDNKIDVYSSYLQERTKLDAIIDKINSYNRDLCRLGDNILTDVSLLLSGISNMSLFNEQRDPVRLRAGLNLLNSLKVELELNKDLKYEYKSFREKIQLINSTKNMLDKLKLEREELMKETAESKKSLDDYESLRNSLNNKLSTEKAYYNVYVEYSEKIREKELLDVQLLDYKNKSAKILEQVSNIQEYKSDIVKLTNELAPIAMEIQRLSGQLLMLDSYYNEYNNYKEKYDMIETLKKYCSPTGGGIQTLFMQLYMSKTLDLSNQVLGMLFNGEYKLLDFVINQNEFRIPFIGSGLPVDDISSGSASQICIMGMIINLVLLHQASTKFNIARLDEIDGPLDARNRIEFVKILHHTIHILNIEQLFIISHSVEVDASSVDIIKLKSYDNFGDSGQLIGNIIYNYDEEIQKHIYKNN